MPKWRNFAKSGCTDIRTNFLIIFFSKMLIKSIPMKYGWSIRICKKAFLVLVPESQRCLTRRWRTRARRSRRTGPRLLGPHPEKTIRFYEGASRRRTKSIKCTAVWPDGEIIFQYLAICNDEN